MITKIFTHIGNKFSPFILGILLVTLISPAVDAQIIDPLKEYTNPDEVVTLDKNTSFEEAIEIINTFSLEYEDKFIVNNSGYNGEIGVSLPPMHWKDALQYIMRFRNLNLEEYDAFYEINQGGTGEGEKAEGGDSKPGAAGSGGKGEAALITSKTREIRINATFFEGNKRALREIGVDWSTLTNNVPANLSDFVAGEQPDNIPETEFSDQFVSVNSYGAQNVSQNAFNVLANLGDLGTGISVQALFSAFEADNLGKVLATPSIKVVDGKTGNIQVGQDFSIKQRDIAGNVTDDFFSTGTILNVTPQIINEGDTTFIYMDLDVERSTAQPDVVSTIVNKQEANTSAILLDGEATHIAGLYRTEKTSVRRGIPILKDLPPWFLGLRYLFGFNSDDYLERELIIIVQAELIKPLDERMKEKLMTKREILNQTRDRNRNDLDRVFEQQQVVDSKPDSLSQDEMLETETDSTMAIEEEMTGEEEPAVLEETVEKEQVKADVRPEDLDMKIEKPELMVVVPKAFSLDEYLEKRENGEMVEESDLKYFVIGGSFIVQDNAYNFMNQLDQQGYDTRMLYHTESRFHFVAYEGFKDFDSAYAELKRIQGKVQDEAWLFTIQSESEQIKE